jgi:hypothetical protein
VDGEPYPKLLQEKGFRGFPSLCFMDAEGNVLTKPTARTVANYVETQAVTKDLMALKAKGDKLTDAEAKQLFLAELNLDMIAAGDIQKRADAVKGLSDADKALVAGKLVDGEFAAILQRPIPRGDAEAQKTAMEETMAQVAAMAKAGKVPSGQRTLQFWSMALQHAATAKDVELAEQAFAALEGHPDAKRMPPQRREGWKKMLDQAKGN